MVPQDVKRISLEQEEEVRYWMKRFEISRERLEQAVDAVGCGVGAVADYLDRHP